MSSDLVGMPGFDPAWLTHSDEPVRYGWGPGWAACTCGMPVDLKVRLDLTGRVLSVEHAGVARA